MQENELDNSFVNDLVKSSKKGRRYRLIRKNLSIQNKFAYLSVGGFGH
jgi:hypothetical protein